MNRHTVDPLTYGRDRVSRSYYDYGRFCAAHPVACISVCILTMVVLSYPALARVKLPISSPMDVYWTQELQPNISKNNSAAPEWLLLQSALYFQQIIVRAHVEPWHSHNMTPVMAIKGPLSTAFNVMEHLEKVKISSLSKDDETINLNSLCFHLPSSPDIFFRNLLPTYGCLLLSPTAFWGKNRDRFLRDENVVSTIFSPQCFSSMCPRDILLGAPTRLTGIKQTFQTNRRRSIEYAITLIQSKYDENFRKALISSLASEFQIVDSMASDESTYVYVFYRPRKYFTDYFPLFASYLLCMIYFYYTVSKFEMVKSKWGLAFAAFNTVFWTLAISSGICAYFDLTSTLWGSGTYPYLAMIIGLENILCITRAVVYTNPTMDVAARVSHGLSHEGYSITKFFLMEMSFLGVGYLTFVSEIQEFCTFAFIALVVDFYMQLFFYTPCLVFDLQRLGDAEKEKFSAMLFKSDIRKLKNYPMPKCPARIILPWMFGKKEKLFRTQSEINLKNSNEKFHRRTLSTDKATQISKNDTPISYRLRLLYFWTRTRFVQRGVMAFFAIWVLWLAFIVHRWKLWDAAISLSKNASSYAYGFGVSHHILDTAPLEWVHWQRQTFKWWPAVFGEYNMSLSGHYVTFLPPIVLQAIIPPNDASLKFYGSNDHGADIGMKNVADPTRQPELQSRITFLERQMTAVLVTSMFLPFCFVVAFILYICFWDRWRQYRAASRKSEDVQPLPKAHLSHNFVELTPLLFSNHEIVIECAAVQSPSTVIFTSLDSRVYICGTYNGEAKQQLARWQPHIERGDGVRHRFRTDTEHSMSEGKVPVNNGGGGNASVAMLQTGTGFNRAQIWAIDVRQNIVALGCSDGSIEVGNTVVARILGRHQNNSDAGVVQIKLKANKVIVGRLNGLLELIGLQFTDTAESPLRFSSLATVKAHQRPITSIECTGLYLFSSGYDRLVKIFDIRTMRSLHTLIRDESPVLELKVDEQVDSPLVLYNRYESGLICGWDVESGEHLHSFTDLQSNGIIRAEMALTSTALVAFSEDGQLFIWNKFTAEFIIRLIAEETFINETSFFEMSRGRILSLGDNNTVVTSIGTCVQFWDVELKALIRQVELPASIETLLIIEGKAILCVSTNTIYRIDLPLGATLRNRIAQ